MKFRIVWLTSVCALAAFTQTMVNGGRVIQGPLNYCADAGSTDSYACSFTPAITSYVSGACYQFKANTANTGAATINLNSLGAVPIKKAAGGVATDLADNDVRGNQIVRVCYDGTNMQMQSQLGNAATGGGSTAPIISTAGEPGFFPLGIVGTSMTSAVVTGAANAGTCHAFVLPARISSSAASFQVTAGSGVGCSGGVCGFAIAIYNKAKALVGVTENGTSNHASLGKNINNNSHNSGVKTLNWASGSAVAAGQLTLDPGSYWVCYSTDSTALQVMVWNNTAWMPIAQRAGETYLDKHGYKLGLTSGNGAALTYPASWTGQLINSGGGSEIAAIYFLP